MFSCPWQPKWSRLGDASDGSREFPRSYGTMQYCLHGANFASILWPVCDIYIDYFNSRLKDDSKTPKNNSLFQCVIFATLRTLINCAQNAKFHSKREQSGYMMRNKCFTCWILVQVCWCKKLHYINMCNLNRSLSFLTILSPNTTHSKCHQHCSASPLEHCFG